MDETLKKVKADDLISAHQFSKQQVRKVWDMKNPNDGFVEPMNLESYQTKNIQAENEQLEYLLNNSTISDQLTKEERAHLENLESRNNSFLLVNKKKFSGDSDLMENVKEAIVTLEQALDQDYYNARAQSYVKRCFEEALEACDKYLKKKNPWFPAGKKRKKMVRERMNTLKKEYEQFQRGQQAERVSEFDKEMVHMNGMGEAIEVGNVYDQKKKEFAEDYDKHLDSMTEHVDDVLSRMPQAAEAMKTKTLGYDARKKVSEVISDNKTYDRFRLEKVQSDEDEDEGRLFSYSKKYYFNKKNTDQIDAFYQKIKSHEATIDNTYTSLIQKFLAEYQKDWQAIDALEFTRNQVMERSEDPNVLEKMEYYEDSVKLLKQHVATMEKALMKALDGEKLTSEEEEQLPNEVLSAYYSVLNKSRW